VFYSLELEKMSSKLLISLSLMLNLTLLVLKATEWLINMKFCVMVELCPGCSSSPFDSDIFRFLQMRGKERERGLVFWPLKSHLMVNISNVR